MLVLHLFASSLLLGGLYRLYAFFSAYGLIKEVGGVLNSEVVLGIFSVALALGLWARRPLARTIAKGIALLGILGPIVLLIYIIINMRALGLAAIFVFLNLQAYATFLSNIASSILAALIAIGLYFVISIGLYRYFKNSADLDAYFYDDLWLDRELVFNGYDFKVYICALLILPMIYLNSIVPAKLRAGLNRKQGEIAMKALQAELEKDPKYMAQKAAAENQKRIQAIDKKMISMARISSDERRALVASSDNKSHLIDLSSGTAQALNIPFESSQNADFLSPDLTKYFDMKRQLIVDVLDASATVAFPPASKVHFLGFHTCANGNACVVFFDNRSMSLNNYDINAKNILWTVDSSLGKKFSDSIDLNGRLWSFTRRWLYLAGSQKPMVVDVRTGAVLEIDIPFRYAHIYRFTENDEALVLSGPVAFNDRENKNKIVVLNSNPTQHEQFDFADLLVGYGFGTKRLIARSADFIMTKVGAGFSETKFKTEVGFSDTFSASPDSSTIAILKSGAKQIEFFDADDGSRKSMGKMFDQDFNFSPKTTRIKWSDKGNIVLVTNRNHLEFFWLTELKKSDGRSLATELPIGP
jgi:hypothetical protein